MPNYIRYKTHGATYFFTVVTAERQPILTHPEVLTALRTAIKSTQAIYPFEIDAWVLLPDHMHVIWSLPVGDANYAVRWSQIKRKTAQACRHLARPSSTSQQQRREINFWQRRFWEHQIRDELDYQRHLDYIHFNPIKHQVVDRLVDWPYSTFHRWVKKGVYPEDWAGHVNYDFNEHISW